MYRKDNQSTKLFYQLLGLKIGKLVEPNQNLVENVFFAEDR